MMREDVIAQWVKIISRYPDNSFFFIARNYLGHITTPFHKPEIIERLTSFFLAPAIQEKIFSLLDDDDNMLISAVMLMDSPSKEDIQKFFSDRLSYVELHKKLVNLEERLIFVPSPNDMRNHISVNPLFHDELHRKAVAFYPLLGENPQHASVSVPDRPFIDGEFLKAFFNLMASGRIPHGNPLPQVDSTVYAKIFPAWEPDRLTRALRLLLASAGNTRIFTLHADKHVMIDKSRMTEILSLAPLHSFCLILAWMLSEKLAFSPDNIQSIQQSVNDFLSTAQKLVPLYKESLPKLITLCLHANGLDRHRIDPAVFQDILEISGAVVVDGNLVHMSAHVRTLLSQQELQQEPMPHGSRLIIDSDGILSYNNPSPAKAHDMVSLIADVRSIDTYVHYEMTRGSFRRARDMGISLENMLQGIEDAVGEGTVPRFLRERLTAWEHLYGEARIYDGITLACSERLSRIIEHVPALGIHIHTRISNNIYLMRRDTEPQWRKILEDAGADMMPASIGSSGMYKKTHATSTIGENHLRWNFTLPPRQNYLLCNVPLQSTYTHQDSSFLNSISATAKKMDLRGDALQEMESRITNKLVLVESQLVRDRLYSGILSASGFDYQGKLNLCKSAVGDASMVLELHLGGDTEDIMVVQAMEVIDATKKNAMLKAKIMPDGQERIIPISSIFRVRRERFSLF
ncbi:helicase-associated domain-containing protein [Parasphaerochaeta coccoides]|uniref:Helicase XPB/Ssl2 N-terminal domain-containing protein n=1 Tax=Parasphaerochaeta coccoides (strain ATCC BAA-1237 / DSM 17374 / SPN1) TaxID=760011 RepID=F4GKZ9_PARC1|nr:helicase-associated domain-containing protein [Parasphaerochaeta coccoides]AEC01912.1 hypothetical protein Spico_0686 [Parasphaerochaeta coccoides DSM 17374]